MPSTTSHLALPYPSGTDPADVPSDIQALASRLASVVQLYGLSSLRPAASAALDGAVWMSTDTGIISQCRAGAWVEIYDPVHGEFHTWALPGEIKVPSADTDYVNPTWAYVRTGELLTLKKVRAGLRDVTGGKSVTFSIQKNGVDTSYAGLVVDSTGEDFAPANVSFADGDRIAPVVTAVANTPSNLAIRLAFERKVIP